MKWLATVLLAYGIIMIALGLYAFIKDKSVMSLVGGGGIGVLAIAGAALAQNYPLPGYGLAALATIAAMGRFGPVLFKKQQIYPAGVIFTLSAVTFICLLIGHFASPKVDAEPQAQDSEPHKL